MSEVDAANELMRRSLTGMVCFLAAVGTTACNVPLKKPDSGTLVDVLEVLYMHQFGNNSSGAQQSAAAYCLKFNNGDPPVQLFERFAGHKPAVVPASGCEVDFGSAVRAKSHLGRAILLRVESVRCSSVRCEARGGYYEGNLSSSGNTYILERSSVEQAWRVTLDQMEWIS